MAELRKSSRLHVHVYVLIGSSLIQNHISFGMDTWRLVQLTARWKCWRLVNRNNSTPPSNWILKYPVSCWTSTSTKAMGWCGWPSSTIWWRWIIQSFVNVSTKCFKVMQNFYHIVTSEWVCASYYEGAYFVQWNFPCPCCYVPATHGDICQSNHNNQCQHCQHQRQ